MFHKIKSVTPLPGYALLVHFADGCARQYNMAPLLDQIDAFAPLRTVPGLFEQVQGGERAVHAFGAAGNDGPHFGVTGFVDKLVHRLFDTFVDHHDDVADAVVVFECLDAPADDWLAAHRLFSSNRVPNPAASTTATTGIFCSCICSPLLICSTVKPRPHATPFRGGFCTQSATVATRITRIAWLVWLVW